MSHQANTEAFGGPRYGFAWEIRDANDKCVAKGDNKLGGPQGDATKGLFEALLAAASAAPPKSSLVVLNKSEYFTNHLRAWSELRARRFLRAGGKKSYADTEAMRKVDAILQEKGITITGRPPAGEEIERLINVQGWASEVAANIGHDPGSWGT